MTTTTLVRALAAFPLTPHTTHIDILEQQFMALQMDDLVESYQFVSPTNQAGSGNNVTNFGTMVQAHPYRYVRTVQKQVLKSTKYCTRYSSYLIHSWVYI